MLFEDLYIFKQHYDLKRKLLLLGKASTNNTLLTKKRRGISQNYYQNIKGSH